MTSYEEEERPLCSHCSGTGMPQFGPPDRGHCMACGGSGVARAVREDSYVDPEDEDLVERRRRRVRGGEEI